MNIDDIRINFNSEQLGILNLCIGFIMFGVALDLSLENFRTLFRQPKALAVGLLSQIVGVPLLTLLIIFILRPQPSLALGLVLVSACPGGNVSNYATHLSRSNTALSVSMTTISTLCAVFITPFTFAAISPLVPGTAELRQSISVEPGPMVLSIAQLILLPLAIAQIFRRLLPRLTAWMLAPVQRLSMIIFFSFIFFALYSNFQNLVNYLHLIFLLVLAHNFMALGSGYFFARSTGLPLRDIRAISLETGIHNSGLGLALIFNFFEGIGGMALIAAWWGVWDLITAFSLAMYWRQRPA